jgi:hypothetical protein
MFHVKHCLGHEVFELGGCGPCLPGRGGFPGAVPPESEVCRMGEVCRLRPPAGRCQAAAATEGPRYGAVRGLAVGC